MLYRNGDNLKSGLISYLKDKEKITIFSPYIKAKTLENLLNASNLRCEQIIVRWEAKDIALGSSDLEIYDICKKHNISLYMNKRIHLKLFTNNFNDAFLGSANISESAICETGGNYEVCALVETINREDRQYLQKIIHGSILITDEIYEYFKIQVPDVKPDIGRKDFKLPNDYKNHSDFLLSKLPMIDTPELLWDLYSNKKISKSQEQENCLCHDLALYEINKVGMEEIDFYKLLAENFFKLPFITSFLEEIDNSLAFSSNGSKREGLRFGAVRVWFSKNTSTAPTPRPFELTKNVQILYSWIEHLSKGKYSVSIPGVHSQVIKLTS